MFAGMFKGGKGLDDSYLRRGFQVVTKRAIVRINLITLLLLGILLPQRRALLFGAQPFDSSEARRQTASKTAGHPSPPP